MGVVSGGRLAGELTDLVVVHAGLEQRSAYTADDRVEALPSSPVSWTVTSGCRTSRIDVLDAEHPGQTSVAYAIDVNQAAATWLSADPVLAPWTQQYVTNQRVDVGNRFPGPLARARHAGPAPLWHVAPPEITVTNTEAG